MYSLKTMDKSRLFQDSFVLFIGALISGAGNFVFQMLMGRMLSSAEYGIMWTMLGCMMILTVPSMAIQNTLAYTIASMDDAEKGAPELFRRSMRKVSRYVLPLLCSGIVFSKVIAGFFKIPTIWPVIFCAICLLFNLYYPVLSGIAQGYQRFVVLSAAGIAGVAIRIAGSTGLVGIFHNASAALAGTALACGGATVLIAVALRKILSGPKIESGLDRTQLYKYFRPVFFSAGVLSLATHSDLLLVKRFFDAETAGRYAQAGAVARLVCYITGPVLTAIFPKVAKGRSATERRHLFLHGFGLSLLVVAAVVAGCLVLPQIPALVLFKTTDPELLGLIRFVVLAFSPLPVFTVVVHYLMARKRFIFLWFCVPAVLAWIVVSIFLHTSIQVIIAGLGFTSMVLLSISLLAVWRDFRADCPE